MQKLHRPSRNQRITLPSRSKVVHQVALHPDFAAENSVISIKSIEVVHHDQALTTVSKGMLICAITIARCKKRRCLVAAIAKSRRTVKGSLVKVRSSSPSSNRRPGPSMLRVKSA